MESNYLSCVTINETPGNILIANTSDEVLMVSVYVNGTRPGNAIGVMVELKDQTGIQNASLSLNYNNFFTAGAYMLTEIVARFFCHLYMKAFSGFNS